jgi:hypothetical protein
MPSKALQHWKTGSKAELNEFAKAHSAVGGEGRGRRYFTRQLNHAYLVAVAAQFQRFCRALHTEGAQRIAGAVPQPDIERALGRLFIENRKLDSGNANDGTLGSDFDRLGVSFLEEVNAADSRNADRRRRLEQRHRPPELQAEATSRGARGRYESGPCDPRAPVAREL